MTLRSRRAVCSVVAVMLLTACAQTTSETPVLESSTTPSALPADNLAIVEQANPSTSGPQTEGETIPNPESVVIHDPSQARDAALAHITQVYNLQPPGSWREQDVTPEKQSGSSELLYTSGPWVIRVSAPATPPEKAIYTVVIDQQQAGLHWEGLVNAFGELAQNEVTPPISVTGPEQARDLALAYIAEYHDSYPPAEWVPQETPQTTAGATRFLYTSGPWVVSITAPASAPLVDSYQVTVDNLTEITRWQGQVSAWGAVTEQEFTQGTPATNP